MVNSQFVTEPRSQIVTKRVDSQTGQDIECPYLFYSVDFAFELLIQLTVGGLVVP